VSNATIDTGGGYSDASGGTTLTATLRLPDVALWWPHTSGSQPMYPLALHIGDHTVQLGAVGFRTVEADRTGGGFTLVVNGVRVFARGACWVPTDVIGLNASYDELSAALRQYVDAGFNVVRITGTMMYESAQFWELCAQLGLLVWQDCMFATLDPPADSDFEAAVVAELRAVFTALQGNPALAVISGGSETEQQPSMLGLAADRRALPLLEKTIPSLAAELLPGVPYVTSTPTGGVPPTRVDTGVAHYFGVGAYLRPLSDARTAGVRFAAECLAFGTPPERGTVTQFFGSDAAAGHHPRWKSAVPRDNGSSWDFEDVREHYVHELFAVDPAALRHGDPERALDLGRAAVAHLVQEVFAEWRRPDSVCAGGIVLSMRDLVPGAGWGLVDSTGIPKAPWYAAARVLAPVAVFVTDEGLNGVAMHVVNDRAEPLEGTLNVQLFGRTGLPLESAATAIDVPPRSARTCSILEVLGVFRDLNDAYRFGPATYDAARITVTDSAGDVRCEATHLFLGQDRAVASDVGLSAVLTDGADGPRLIISTRDLAQWVSIECGGFVPSDSWFHIAPGGSRTVALRPASGGQRTPAGTVRALNSRVSAAITRG
jgi:beta-mannosidase